MNKSIIDYESQNGNRDDLINLAKTIHIRRIRSRIRIYYSPWRWFTIKCDDLELANELMFELLENWQKFKRE